MESIYTEQEIKLREVIFDSIRYIPSSTNDEMYEVLINIAGILRESGIDLLTKKERENISNTAHIILMRFTRDSSIKDKDTNMKQQITDSILFLIRLIDDVI